MTATVNAGEFRRLLGNALLFAAADSELPAISGVRLTVADGQLTARATDRYTAYREDVKADTKGSSDLFLARADVRHVMQAVTLGLPRGRAGKAEHQVHLTPTRKAEEPLLSVSSGRVTAEVEYRVVGKPDDEHPELLEVPEFDKLLAPDDEAPLAVTHVNPRYLLRVAQVQHPPTLGGPPVSVEMRGYRKPVIFRWPNHTEAVAIVMPVRTQVDE